MMEISGETTVGWNVLFFKEFPSVLHMRFGILNKLGYACVESILSE